MTSLSGYPLQSPLITPSVQHSLSEQPLHPGSDTELHLTSSPWQTKSQFLQRHLYPGDGGSFTLIRHPFIPPIPPSQVQPCGSANVDVIPMAPIIAKNNKQALAFIFLLYYFEYKNVKKMLK